MIDAVTEIYPQIPVCVRLDHGDGTEHLRDHNPGRLHLGHGGRLAEGRRQTPAD